MKKISMKTLVTLKTALISMLLCIVIEVCLAKISRNEMSHSSGIFEKRPLHGLSIKEKQQMCSSGTKRVTCWIFRVMWVFRHKWKTWYKNLILENPIQKSRRAFSIHITISLHLVLVCWTSIWILNITDIWKLYTRPLPLISEKFNIGNI